MPEEQSEVKSYWDQQARINRQSSSDSTVKVLDERKNVYIAKTSTLKDHNLRELEIRSVARYIERDDNVLDLGCGDGYATGELVRRTGCQITGVDISDEMIQNALTYVTKLDKSVQDRMSFKVGSIDTVVASASYFNKVVTIRCLINVLSKKEQFETIKKIATVLRPGGRFLMLEGETGALSNLNSVRVHFGLQPIPVVWHNLFFDEPELVAEVEKYFVVDEINRFSSSYMLVSRAVHPAIQEPDYNAKINEVALRLSEVTNFGDYGYLKLFVFRRK